MTKPSNDETLAQLRKKADRTMKYADREAYFERKRQLELDTMRFNPSRARWRAEETDNDEPIQSCS